EGVAISGAPFFAYFLWQDKESESAPAGDETQDAPPTPSLFGKTKKVGQPRQGMKQGLHHKCQALAEAKTGMHQHHQC
ncbi:hypothetical protein, partial [Ralstonia pseudosolanacearum]|uniref:hypothetical protein n=1 Tax=Ralstonia pseudosolanacearum TaxID=1310165 RepID=UPI003CF00709